ncbi:alpha/beta hydrolase-fold protein [uncultured Sphaerochaeta sp.]
MAEELPRLSAMLVPSAPSGRSAIAGLSMGGYGVLKAVLTNPMQSPV